MQLMELLRETDRARLEEVSRDLGKFISLAGKSLAIMQAERTDKYTEFIGKIEEALTEQYEPFTEERAIVEVTGTFKADFTDDQLTIVNREMPGFSLPDIVGYLKFFADFGGQRILDELEVAIKFGLTNNQVLQQLARGVSIQSINQTSRTFIANKIIEGKQAGLTNRQIANWFTGKVVAGIQGDVQVLTKTRAELIAHAEMVNAIAQVEQETYQRNGVSRWKWRDSRDGRVSDGCMENHEFSDRQGFVEIGFVFTGGGTAVTRPPRHPRCRCVMQGEVLNTPFIPWTGE
jgi:hypothetical protein